ncbi:hypothetical protein V2G26_006135 [Clonostachys chloroleuca]
MGASVLQDSGGVQRVEMGDFPFARLAREITPWPLLQVPLTSRALVPCLIPWFFCAWGFDLAGEASYDRHNRRHLR